MALCVVGFCILQLSPLVLLGIVLYFVGKQDATKAHLPRPDDWPEGLDLSSHGEDAIDDLDSMDEEADEDEEDERWIDRFEERQLEVRRRREEEEDRRVDEILQRVHKKGLAGLSPDERALLQRVSRRYRNRPNPSS